MSRFFTTGGTLHHNSPSYVERESDKQLFDLLSQGEFCYVLTARQMGKSSSMVRAAMRLKEVGIDSLILDLTAIGQNLNIEQWYDGLLVKIGQTMHLEDELEDYWMDHPRMSPVQRWFQAVRNVILPRIDKKLVIFFDELDMVRSLPFPTDELFGAIRQCYNQRIEDPEYQKLTFCLLGVATPADLIKDPNATPFNIGHRVPLNDFSHEEALPLAKGLEEHLGNHQKAERLLKQIHHWTHGHPYLTQRLCRAVIDKNSQTAEEKKEPEAWVDWVCGEIFLSSRAREKDDNLLYVRERIRRSQLDQMMLLELYENVLNTAKAFSDDDTNPLISELFLSGLVRVEKNHLVVRNRIYAYVYNAEWIERVKPMAEIELTDGQRVRIKSSCSIGRTAASTLCLPNQKVSRRHAMIQKEKSNQLWLIDADSRNGTFHNGCKVTEPTLLRDKDQINIGPFCMIFHQTDAPRDDESGQASMDKTVFDL
jgi:hypothetical protein